MIDVSTLRAMLRELLKPGSRRCAVYWAMKEKRYSQRRARRVVGTDPLELRYRSTRPVDEGVRARLRELAGERRRFGYRRLHILLAREGVEMNWRKLYRLHREEGLTIRTVSYQSGSPD